MVKWCGSVCKQTLGLWHMQKHYVKVSIHKTKSPSILCFSVPLTRPIPPLINSMSFTPSQCGEDACALFCQHTRPVLMKVSAGMGTQPWQQIICIYLQAEAVHLHLPYINLYKHDRDTHHCTHQTLAYEDVHNLFIIYISYITPSYI